MSKQATEWRALCSQQWVQEKILAKEKTSLVGNVKFSDKSEQKMLENMKKNRQNRNSRFLENLAQKAKEGKASEQRIIHLNVKLACFKMIIEFGKKVENIMPNLEHIHFCYFRRHQLMRFSGEIN